MDGERDRISLQAILDSELASPTLVKRAKELDADGDGSLSIGELLHVVRAEQSLMAEKRLLIRILIALGCGLLLTIAAVVGLTYAVVDLAKETTVGDGGVLQGKSSKSTVGTAAVVEVIHLGNWLDKNVTLTDFLALEAVGIGIEATHMQFYRVSSLEHIPGHNLTVHTTQPGVSITVTREGIDLNGATIPHTARQGSERMLQPVAIDGAASSWVVEPPSERPCEELKLVCDNNFPPHCEYKWVDLCDF